jgi:hypothetical protein
MWWVAAVIGLLQLYHRWYVRASGHLAGSPVFAPAIEGAISAAAMLAFLLPVFYLGTWAWRALFRRWPAPGPPGSPTSTRDYVRFRSAAVVAVVLFVASLATTVSAALLGVRLFQPSRPAPTVSVTDARRSAEAKEQLRSLWRRGIEDPDSLPEVKARQWELLKEHGRATAEFVEVARASLSAQLRYQELFWEDAAVALRTGKPFKSPERERLEKELLKEEFANQDAFAENDAMIADIAAGKPVLIADDVMGVMTAELIEATIADAPRRRAALDELLTPPEGLIAE